MVQRLSAQLYLPGESCYPINSGHTDLVKFDSPQEKAFQTIVTSVEVIIGMYLECSGRCGSACFWGP